MKKDIETRADVATLVQTFYQELVRHDLMSPHFTQTDFEHHMPRMIGFWAFILLDEPMQIGNVFEAHRHLDIDERHFKVWIDTFCATVEALFEGKNAEKAKQNAQVIGFTFQSKMAHLRNNA